MFGDRPTAYGDYTVPRYVRWKIKSRPADGFSEAFGDVRTDRGHLVTAGDRVSGLTARAALELALKDLPAADREYLVEDVGSGVTFMFKVESAPRITAA
jgi:hypothetical protein